MLRWHTVRQEHDDTGGATLKPSDSDPDPDSDPIPIAPP